jgi:hypothetical protein
MSKTPEELQRAALALIERHVDNAVMEAWQEFMVEYHPIAMETLDAAFKKAEAEHFCFDVATPKD